MRVPSLSIPRRNGLVLYQKLAMLYVMIPSFRATSASALDSISRLLSIFKASSAVRITVDNLGKVRELLQQGMLFHIH